MFKRINIGDGITFYSNNTRMLKFNSFAICLMIEKTKRNLLLSNMLASLFSSTPITFSSDKMFHNYLKNIYGADLEVYCKQIDDKIDIEINLSILSDRYALDKNENLCEKAIKILCDVLFCADIRSRKLYKKIIEDTTLNTDCIARGFAELIPNTVAGINQSNSVKELLYVSFNEFNRFYKMVLEHADICIFGIGDFDENYVVVYFKSRFSAIRRNPKAFSHSLMNLNEICKKDVSKTHGEADSSRVTFFYNLGFTDISPKNIALANLYADFLYNELHFIVRDNKGFFYSLGAYAYFLFNALTIWVNVTEENLEKITLEVKSAIKSFYLSPSIKEQFFIQKERFKNSLDMINEQDFEIFLELVHYGEITNEVIDDISFEEFVDFCNRIANDKSFIGSYFEERG